MTTKQYIKKFKLDDIQYSNHFNTDLFLQNLNEEFVARMEREKGEREKARIEFTYKIFQGIIQEMQTKFCAISNKKVGGPLRPELWNAFYAKYVIPVRESYFPKEHADIQAKREVHQKKLIMNQVVEELEAKGTKSYFDQSFIKAEVEKRYNAKKKNPDPKKLKD